MRRNLEVADRVILLLSLIPYLRDHGSTSVTELAQVFEVEEPTIRKLVVFLGTAGIPGETHTYQANDLFDIDWDAFEHEDLVSLTQIVAVDDTPRFSAAEYAALLAGLQALKVILPAEQQAVVASTAAKLALAAPPETAEPTNDSMPLSITADPVDPQLSVIVGAIEQRHRLSFTYQDMQGASTIRCVEPLSLKQSGSDWYLRGYCLDREAERTFLLASMRDTRDSNDRADRNGTDEAFAFEPSPAALQTSIQVRASALHAIAGFRPQVLEESAPGWFQAEVFLDHPAAAIRLVQAAPMDVRIIAPAMARDAVNDWASRALAPYDL